VTSLDVICVNWNSGGQLAACLASLARVSREGFTLGRVVVVDNASSDGSAESLAFPTLPLEVIANDTNRGFAAGCNQGARGSRSDYLLFLNPDTVVEPDSVARPLAVLESAEGRDIGICGIQLANDQGVVARTCTRFPSAGAMVAASVGLDRLVPPRYTGVFMNHWDHLDSRTVDHVIGAFYLVRRELFETLGGFDEGYFVYFEDLDFSLRARKAGWRSFYLASARAYHRGGGSSEQVKAERLLYLLRSRLHYARRHFGWMGAFAVTLATAVVEPITRVGVALARGTLSQVRDTFRAYGMLFAPTARADAVRRDVP
jgi:N-acetylglucosaminyl-diphospho-decaprenol L-rhamnosyltransferase